MNLQRVLFPIITLLLLLGWYRYWFTFGLTSTSFALLGIMLAGNIISILVMIRSVNTAGQQVSAHAVRMAQIFYSVILAVLPGLVFAIAYAGQVDMLYPLITSYVLLVLALALALSTNFFSKKKTRQNTVSTSPSSP
jgi:uncharacterized membrane protein